LQFLKLIKYRGGVLQLSGPDLNECDSEKGHRERRLTFSGSAVGAERGVRVA